MSCLHHRGLQILQTSLGNMCKKVNTQRYVCVCSKSKTKKRVGLIGGKFTLIMWHYNACLGFIWLISKLTFADPARRHLKNTHPLKGSMLPKGSSSNLLRQGNFKESIPAVESIVFESLPTQTKLIYIYHFIISYSIYYFNTSYIASINLESIL